MTPKPMTSKSRKNRNSEKGFALLIAIFTLLLLTAIGAGMVALTNTDTSISANFRDEQTAFFAGKAGIEEARDRLRNGPNTIFTNAYFSTGVLPGAPNGVLYILNNTPATAGETITPWATTGNASVYPDTEICSELTNIGTGCGVLGGGGWYTSTSNNVFYGATPKLPWKWVRITAKTDLTSSGTSVGGTTQQAAVDGNLLNGSYRVCWNGANEVAISSVTYATCGAYPVTPQYLPVYVLTALAVTPSGSRRMIQAETTLTVFPTVPGPLVFDGASPVFGVPHSSVFSVDGTDHSGSANLQGPGASCPSGRPTEYALGAFNAAGVTTLQADGSNRPNNYTGLLNPLPPGTSNMVSAGDVSSQLGSLATVGGLEAIQSELALVAGNEGNTTSILVPIRPSPTPGALPTLKSIWSPGTSRCLAIGRDRASC